MNKEKISYAPKGYGSVHIAGKGHGSILSRESFLVMADMAEKEGVFQKNESKVINLLTKGSEKHCKYQLRKSPVEHIEDIKKTVKYANHQWRLISVYQQPDINP